MGLLVIICIINAFSYPWPNSLGGVEFLLAILLAAIFFKGFIQLLVKINIGYIYILILVMMCGVGIVRNPINDVIRDLIPFIYLGIPIAFYVSFRRRLTSPYQFFKFDDPLIYRFLLSISFIGVVYSLRAIWPFYKKYGFDHNAIYHSVLYPHTDYIFLDPSLIFGASFLIVFSVGRLGRHEYFRSVMFACLSLACIAAPYYANIRAPSFLYVLVFIIALIYRFRSKSLLLLPFPLFFMSTFISLFGKLLSKQADVGANGKMQEISDIVNYMLSLPIYNIMFGVGLGGTYDSSVLGGTVRFTHNIFSYAMLKGGFITLMVTLIVFVIIMSRLSWKIIQAYKLKDTLAFASLIACFASLSISSLLEPGYKTLNFSFILIIYVYFVLSRKNTISNR
jgi:hypothetical protein